ncbi:unnamed protein product, partial [Mesorhabditis belari]|uniref:Cytochrome P450 n=1 Tax=Mesorhabditis belari TaxID=2138241 RepID=A0AAF3FB81_9BILA
MLFVLGLISLLTFITWQYYKKTKLPPGPYPWLFFGNIPELLYLSLFEKLDILEIYQWLMQKYGKVFTLWLGPMPTVNICDYEVMYDVFVRRGNEHSRRYEVPFLCLPRSDNSGKIHGVMMSNDDLWNEHRKFIVRVLKNFGIGKGIIEDRIMDEFERQFAGVEKKMENGSATIDFSKLVDLCIGNTINRIIFGYRFDEDNYKNFHSVKVPLDEAYANVTTFHNFLRSWFKSLPYLNKFYDNIMIPQEKVLKFAEMEAKKRHEAIENGTYSLEGEPMDFIDAYLMEQRRLGGNETTMNDFGLYTDILDLWVGGQETTSLTLNWAFIFLLRHPEVVEKCRKEIHMATDGIRDVRVSDKESTPYVNATITEILRLSHILNLNLMRETIGESKFGDYTVPAGTKFSPVVSVIMMDPKNFEQPNQFRPERFIENPSKAELVVPFLIGRRVCFGEPLARNELYLFITNVLQRYAIAEDPKCPLEKEVRVRLDGWINRVKPYKMKLTKLN